MEESTQVKVHSQAKVLIAAAFLLPTLYFAQTQKQVSEIQNASNFQALTTLEGVFKRQAPKVQELKQMASERSVPFSGEVNGKAFQLQGFDKKTGLPFYFTTYNAGAAAGTGTNRLNSSAGIFNLDGQNMRVYEWDGGGVRTTHKEFGGRVTQGDKPMRLSAHATHVAGTMVASGINGLAKGMAPMANLMAFDWVDDNNEMTTAAKFGALVSNHSYGYIGGFSWGNWSGITGWHWLGDEGDQDYVFYGKYTERDRGWDLIAMNAPYYLPVKAAGNDRNNGPDPGNPYMVYVKVNKNAPNDKTYEWRESKAPKDKNCGRTGFDCINQGALAKNIITIGAAEKVVGDYQNEKSVKMASFSSYGPSDDGRIKPDFSGIGVDILSSISSRDDAYGITSGTSMASPNVTGSLLLLQQHYSNLNAGKYLKAATLKALAIATANEAGNSPGPDYGTGWGLLNSYGAAVAISTKDQYTKIEDETLKNKETKTYNVTASGTEPLKVTIAWTDPVPSDNMMPKTDVNNDRTSTLVNDLDVVVTAPDGTTKFYPWKLDPANPANAATTGDNTVDNVEQVVVSNPIAGGVYTISVSHKNTLKSNVFTTKKNDDGKEVIEVTLKDAASQNFGLVVSGINNNINTDLALTSVKVAVPTAQFTTETPVNFIIENKGKNAVSGATLKYQLINENGKVEKEASADIPNIEAGKSGTVTVKLDLTKSFVNYRITGEIILKDEQITVNNKNETTVFGNLADLVPDKAKHTFGFEEEFLKNGWTSQDVDKNGKTWYQYGSAEFAKDGNKFAINFPSRAKGSNDWLFSNPLKVKGGDVYRVSFYSRKFQKLTENLQVGFGDSPNKDGMTTIISNGIFEVPSPGNLDKAYSKYFFEFTPNKDGVIYVGFNNKTPDADQSYAVAIDLVTFERSAGAPVIDFDVDKIKANTFDKIQYKSVVVAPSKDPVTKYEWAFSPNNVEYLDGTNANSQNPVVRFTAEGLYSATLTATNNAGKESKTISEARKVKVANKATVAKFRTSQKNVYVGETVVITNTSTGEPAPNQFKWEITPSDGVEFTNANGDTAKDAVIKMKKSGTYTVKLTATSPNNSDTTVLENAIVAEEVRKPVQNLTYELDNGTGDVKLKWETPIKAPVYYDSFDGGKIPADMATYNANDDALSWLWTYDTGVNKTGAIISFSWFFAPLDTDDWIVTPKLRAGAEVVKYMQKQLNPERYDVYVIPATGLKTHPTVDEIKKLGKVVYTNEMKTDFKSEVFKKITVDISKETPTDFYLAFHHRTKKEDRGLMLVFDDLMVGYKDSVYRTEAKESNSVKEDELTDMKLLGQISKNPELAVTDFNPTLGKNAFNPPIVNFGVIDVPALKGYKVDKNKTLLANTNQTTQADKLTQNGSYTYDVYAVYEGGESVPMTVVVDLANLSTADAIKNATLKIYPNPSSGMFVVETATEVSSFKAEVYDMSGKLIFNKDYKGNKGDINLTQYGKGVYILMISDNTGKKQSAKLMIK